MIDKSTLQHVSDKTVRPDKRTSKERIKATNGFIRANYDRITLTVPKGDKAAIQKAAAAVGESVNEYIRRAISARMGSD